MISRNRNTSSRLFLGKPAGRPLLLLLLLLTAIVWHGCRSSRSTLPHTPPEQEFRYPLQEPVARFTTDRRDWPADPDPEQLLSSMTLREKIGQLMFIPVNGRFFNEKDPRYLEWERLVTRYHPGGLIFMAGDIYGQAVMTRKFQSLSRLPLWISQDMEFGAAMRVSGTTRFTPAMGVAASGDPQNAWLTGKITAREAKALGVHQIYAPVLDVNNNPDNPVINVRSYSSDPEMVARFGEAFIRGVESEGVLATAKHFPGHGDTDTDSHLALPVIHHDWARLDSLELHPFRSAIRGGLRSIMSAHIAFPGISPTPGLPGTLDPVILTGILADTLGFDGLVVTDGLEMSGISSHYSPGRAVIMALQAGADIMLISPDAVTAIHEVEMAVRRGVIPEERIDHSVRKILQLKIEHGLFRSNGPDPDALSWQIGTPVYAAEADRIARQSITLVRNRGEVLPIRYQDFRRIVVVAVADDRSGTTGTMLATEMRRYHPEVLFHVLDQRSGEEEKEKIMEDARRADLLVIGSFIFVRSSQPTQLTPEQLEFLRRLENMRKPSVVIAFGNPYVLRDLNQADVHLLAWSGTAHQIRNTVPALFGGAAIGGRLPIPIPGLYEMGEGIDLPHSALRPGRPETVGMWTDSLMVLDEIMQKAVEDSVFPGGAIAVVKDGVLVWNRGYGYHDYDKTRAVRESDVFDLASVTKVTATTTAVMKLVDERRLSLDDPVWHYIPEYDVPEKREVTIAHLLLHTSGLPSFRTYVDRLTDRNEIIQAVRNEPLIARPGERYTYSDLGFILLGEIVEKVSGERLDRFARNAIFFPLGMHSTRFNPAEAGNWMRQRIPPTEIDTIYRKMTVQGEVHDERAWYMGGVAGHAGLFSTAGDLAVWAQMLLNRGYYAGQRILKPETVELFTSMRSDPGNRAYGFDRKSEGFSTAGSLTGERTYGHLGFTGTSVWIDPDSNLAIILLTNRTWPLRGESRPMSLVRAEVADAVVRSLQPEHPAAGWLSPEEADDLTLRGGNPE